MKTILIMFFAVVVLDNLNDGILDLVKKNVPKDAAFETYKIKDSVNLTKKSLAMAHLRWKLDSVDKMSQYYLEQKDIVNQSLALLEQYPNNNKVKSNYHKQVKILDNETKQLKIFFEYIEKINLKLDKLDSSKDIATCYNIHFYFTKNNQRDSLETLIYYDYKTHKYFDDKYRRNFTLK